ncbi:MAG: DUF1573 domain-containing protein [Muribaculaceae bacterium]|nr:DUF1573 domain-containing protein [Muribaculaceae bacterium]
MKRLIRSILLLTLVACCPLLAADNGVVTWVSDVHDFGTFKEEIGKVTHEFLLVNTGDSPLTIVQVRPTCGCTTGEFSHMPVQPGDTTTISVTFDPENRPGQFTKDIWVVTNGTPNRSRITIKGNVIGSAKTVSDKFPVSVGPIKMSTAVVPLGEINQNNAKLGYINVYNTAPDTMLITFSDYEKPLRPEAVPDTVPPGQRSTITVFYDAHFAPLIGLNTSTAMVTAKPLHPSSQSTMGMGQIEVMAQVREDFSRLSEEKLKHAPVVTIVDEKVDFKTFSEPKTVKIEVKNKGKDPLIIRRVQTYDKGITASCDITKVKKGKTANVSITVDPALLGEKLLNNTITIITNDPENPVLDVRLVGIIKN